jgi:hypothetical protein
LDLVVIGPQIDQLTTEFAAMIAEQPPWCTALRGEPIEYLHDMLAAEPLARLNGQVLSGAHVDDGQGLIS